MIWFIDSFVMFIDVVVVVTSGGDDVGEARRLATVVYSLHLSAKI